MNTKQVIVMRKDLKMRRGKEISQGAHASMAFITRNLEISYDSASDLPSEIHLTRIEIDWLQSSFRKICLQVNSQKELLDLARRASEAGIENHLVTDNGLTEFDGVATLTCLALGPDEDEKIDAITKDLKLY